MLLKMRSARPPDAKKRADTLLRAISYRVAVPVTKWIQLPVGGYIYPVCPRCKISMEREYMNFCDRCGQKLSWDYIDHAELLYVPDKSIKQIKELEEP